MTDHIETPDEIAASLAKREEAFLRWAQSRAEVTRSAPARSAAVPAASLTREWKDYIDAVNKRWLEASMAAVGETLVREREAMRKEFRAELEREVAALRNEFLRDRLDAERGTKRLKVVLQDTLIA